MFLNLFMYLLIFLVITADCNPPNKLQPTQRGICSRHHELLLEQQGFKIFFLF